jgi:nitroimidazol reductase NimA-like FMN-containing flavoprotein (pyridoxamine 5'-phosphate oxidase superfamily)
MGKIEQPTKARIKELTRAEIETILGRNHVGRIAFSFHDRVDIRPLHYVYKNSWIYGCTSKGSKIETIAHNMWVAFEVDEVVATFDWRSVVIRGSFHIMSATASRQPDPNDTSVREDPEYSQAVAALRTFLPDAMMGSDPTPFRYTVFRIHLDEATGRESTPTAKSATQ